MNLFTEYKQIETCDDVKKNYVGMFNHEIQSDRRFPKLVVLIPTNMGYNNASKQLELIQKEVKLLKKKKNMKVKKTVDEKHSLFES